MRLPRSYAPVSSPEDVGGGSARQNPNPRTSAEKLRDNAPTPNTARKVDTPMKETIADSVPLVVDDEPFSLSIVVGILKDLKCAAVLEAKDGERAMDAYASDKKPNLSIVDFNMPKLNGLQLLKTVRTGRARMPRNHRFLMLTGNADLGLVRAAIALDVDSFIVKPASKQVLADRIQKSLSERPKIKSIMEYEEVDIEAVNKRFLGHDPVGTPDAAPTPARSDFQEWRVALEEVKVGAILAKNIVSPAGDLLIARGTPLTARFVSRLQELKGVIGLEFIDILVPLGKRRSG